MKKVLAVAFILLLAVVFTSSNAYCAEDFMSTTQGYGVGAWYTSFYGSYTDTTGAVLSLRGQAGLRNGWGVNVDAGWQFSDKWGADFNYAYIHSSANNFDTPSPIGENINSRINLSTASFMLKYNLARSQDGMLDVAVVPQYVDINNTTTGVLSGVNYGRVHRSVFIPCVGLSGKQRLSDKLYIYGDIHGMATGRNSHLLDFRADLRWNFQTPGWYATLGYRVFDRRDGKMIFTDWTGSQTVIGKFNWNGPMATIRYEF